MECSASSRRLSDDEAIFLSFKWRIKVVRIKVVSVCLTDTGTPPSMYAGLASHEWRLRSLVTSQQQCDQRHVFSSTPLDVLCRLPGINAGNANGQIGFSTKEMVDRGIVCHQILKHMSDAEPVVSPYQAQGVWYVKAVLITHENLRDSW